MNGRIANILKKYGRTTGWKELHHRTVTQRDPNVLEK